MSVRVQMKVPPGETPPRAGGLYWICQAAGWGGFTAYALTGYLTFADDRNGAVIASIVIIDALVCPALTQVLRHWMYTHGWLRMSPRRLLPRSVAAMVLMATAITALVLLMAPWLPGGDTFSLAGALWMYAAFLFAFATWLVIYFRFQSRRREEARALQLTLDARNTELKLLRAQINPHFLFNCLNSLRALIAENPERASSMVTSLSDLLRYSLQSGRNHTVSLAEELAIVDEYVSLERVRFENRLRFERSLSPSALGHQVPPMLVQTLVENAVKHGIAELPEGGVVRMAAEVKGRQMAITVSNTGTMRAPLNEEGYGLRNTMDRLRLLYGDDVSFSLTDASGDTVATVTLPLEPIHESAAG